MTKNLGFCSSCARRYLLDNEKGPVRTFATDAATRPGLDMLFAKLAFVRAGPVARFWFIFWHALWEGNSEVEIFEKNADVLDPDQPEAIANIPMPRKEVEALVKAKELDKWIHAKLLDVLYQGLEQRSEGTISPLGVSPAAS